MIKNVIILIFFLFVFPLFSNLISAKENAKTEITDTESLDVDQQVILPTIVKYDMAFPGLLPDHPMYKLKILRDKISAGLISDPLKKIDFYLLQTDKGILAAAMLVDKNKIELAKQTALKAEHNYTLLTYQLYRISKKPNKAFFDRLKTASLKHQEILLSLIKRLPENEQETFKQIIDFSNRNLNTVQNYQKGNY